MKRPYRRNKTRTNPPSAVGRTLFTRLYNAASNQTSRFFERVKMTEHIFMIFVAIIIGVLGGLGAVGIRALIREISGLFYPGGGTLLDNIVAAPWYLKLLIPALGGLIVGPIIHRWAPEAKGTGVPEVMQSVLTKGGRIRPRVALIKSIVSTITIGTGGSVGREGPIVQIGASLGSTIGQFFRIPSKRMKTLVGCGAAAGIAAAFNTPVAGALFAVEIILMDYAVASFSPIIISSVMATVVSHAFEGDFPAIEVIGEHLMHSPYEIALYAALGVLTGVVSWVFIKSVFYFGAGWESRVKFPSYLKPALGGLAIGVIAQAFPQVMGVGYDSINLALNHESMTYMGVGATMINSALGSHTFWLMVMLLCFAKIFATSMTLGSGGSGGIFAPSLFIGAMLGASFGHFAHLLLPDITASPGTYALIAMGGLVAGSTRAPIMAIITIFEMTKENAIILPLMITCIISTIVSAKFSRESIYTLKLLLRNINIRGHAEVNVMKSLHVKDVYSTEFVSVSETRSFNDIVTTIMSTGHPFVSIHDRKHGFFIGTVSINDIKDVLFHKEALMHICIAGDVSNRSIEILELDDNCSTALKKMRRCGQDCLPVMDPNNDRRQIGVVWLNDILEAYDREIEHIDLTSGLAEKIVKSNLEGDIRFLEGYVITEFKAPRSFVGRTIAQLQVRNKYGVDILSIKSHAHRHETIEAIPRADTKIKPGDTLVVAGKSDRVNQVKNLS